MKKVIIAIVMVGVLAVGHFIYREFFAHQRAYYSILSESQATELTGTSPTETPSKSNQYSDWVGEWAPENGLELSDPYYLHVELDSSGLPAFDIKILEGFAEKRPHIELELVGTLDDYSVKCKFEADDMPKEMSMEVILKHNPATDKLEWMVTTYKNGEKIEEEGKMFFIRKERWEELASKGLPPSDTSQPGIRNKVSRVRADMRSMASGLEAYIVDTNHYPASVPGTHPLSFNKAPATREMPSFRLGVNTKSPKGRVMAIPMTLTTPIAYLTRYFEDPFK